MKFLNVLVLCLAFSGVAQANNTTKGVDVKVVVPDQVLSVLGSQDYQDLVETIEATINKGRNPEIPPKKLMVLEFSMTDASRIGAAVKIIVGTTTNYWPTYTVPVGEVQSKVRFFPDGINRYRAEDLKYTPIESR